MNLSEIIKNGTFKFMNEDTIIIVSIAGFFVLVVLIILLANWLDSRMKKKQGARMRKDMENGTYNPKKKYFGNQGNWEPGDDPNYYNDNNRVN